MRHRFTSFERPETGIQEPQRPGTLPERGTPAYRSGIVRDLSRLAVMFLAVALANIVFLLIALSFLSRTGPLAQ